MQKDFDLTDEGPLQDYLETRFDRKSDGSVTLNQPRIVYRAISIIGLYHPDSHVKMYDTPEVEFFHSDPSSKPKMPEIELLFCCWILVIHPGNGFPGHHLCRATMH